MKRENCWEVRNCGREPGGDKAVEMGVCPATIDTEADGLNEGKNAGRICWAVSGTFCGDEVQGTYADKQVSCMSCQFFKQVKHDEGEKFVLLKPGQQYATTFNPKYL